MMHPWMQFYTRDWLDSKELRRCSLAARGLLADLMAIAHEGYPYGYLADKVGALTEDYLASRCMVPLGEFRALVKELRETAERLSVDTNGTMYVPRLVEDAKNRQKKTEAGRKGGNPSLLKREVNHDGKPNAQARYDSDSIFGSEKQKIPILPSQRFSEVWDRWPRKTGMDQAARDWIDLVTVENEAEVLACVDRYLASDEVIRGAVRNLGTVFNGASVKAGWLADCARDGWKCTWPTGQGNGKQQRSSMRADWRALQAEADTNRDWSGLQEFANGSGLDLEDFRILDSSSKRV